MKETLRDPGTGGKQAAREQNGPSPGGRSLIVMFRLLRRLKQPTWWRELGWSGDVPMTCPVLRSVMRYVGVRCREGGQESPSEEGTRTAQQLQSSTEPPVLAGWGREMRKSSSRPLRNLECRLRPRKGAFVARRTNGCLRLLSVYPDAVLLKESGPGLARQTVLVTRPWDRKARQSAECLSGKHEDGGRLVPRTSKSQSGTYPESDSTTSHPRLTSDVHTHRHTTCHIPHTYTHTLTI